MVTVDERVAFLEGRVNEQSQMINGIREAIVSLEQRMDRRFEGMDRRFESLDQRLNVLDQKMDTGFAALDQKMDHRFAWLVGIQLTTTTAAVGTVLAALLAR